MQKTHCITFGIIMLISISSITLANGELSYEEKLEFVSEKEQIVGHIISALYSIQDKDYDVAKMHLMHPIATNFPNIQPFLLKNDLETKSLDLILRSLIFVDPKSDFKLIQYKLVPIFTTLREIENELIDEQLKKDSSFQLQLIVILLEKSIAHYHDHLELDDKIAKKTTKQDSLSLVIKSHMLLDSIFDKNFDQSIMIDFNNLFISYEYNIEKVPILLHNITDKINGIVLENIKDSDNQTEYQKDLEEIQNIEEVLGHLYMAQEHAQNNNSKLAIAHVNHAIHELQNKLHASNTPQKYMDQLLLLLYITNSFDFNSIDNYDKNIYIVRSAIDEIKINSVGKKIINDQRFQTQIAIYLLELAKSEYELGLRSGEIFENNIEIQDAYAFTKQVQKILKNNTNDELDLNLEELIRMIQNVEPNKKIEEYIDLTINNLHHH